MYHWVLQPARFSRMCLWESMSVCSVHLALCCSWVPDCLRLSREFTAEASFKPEPHFFAAMWHQLPWAGLVTGCDFERVCDPALKTCSQCYELSAKYSHPFFNIDFYSFCLGLLLTALSVWLVGWLVDIALIYWGVIAFLLCEMLLEMMWRNRLYVLLNKDLNT